MPTVAVTVVGADRPGIVAEVAGAVAEQGGNLEDSSMTLLRGHFAMTLIAEVDDAAQLEERLAHLAAEDLSVTVIDVPGDDTASSRPARYLLSLHGADRPGIVSATARAIASGGGNIVDVTTRLGSQLYVMTAEVEFADDAAAEAVIGALGQVAQQLGVQLSLVALDPAGEEF